MGAYFSTARDEELDSSATMTETNVDTDPDAAAAAVSNAIIGAGEKAMRTMTWFMHPASVLDSFPEDPNARRVNGITPDGTFSHFNGNASSSTDASNHIYVQDEGDEAVTASDNPPLTDPVDVLMTRVAPQGLVRMMSSTSSTAPAQSELRPEINESAPSIDNV